VHTRVSLVQEEFHKPHCMSWLREKSEELNSMSGESILDILAAMDAVLTDPGVTVPPSPLGIDLDSVIITSSKVLSSWSW
jgi:hypothetical protein